MMPSDMLEHIFGLLPDPMAIYEVVFLDLLPPAARDAALQHSSLSAMAAAADKIVREGSSAPAAAPSSISVASVSAAVGNLDLDDGVAAISRPPPSAARRSRQRSGQHRSGQPSQTPRSPSFLCSSHARWGRNSFRCADPASCHMKDIIRPRQEGLPPQRSAQGNGGAGGQ